MDVFVFEILEFLTSQWAIRDCRSTCPTLKVGRSTFSRNQLELFPSKCSRVPLAQTGALALPTPSPPESCSRATQTSLTNSKMTTGKHAEVNKKALNTRIRSGHARGVKYFAWPSTSKFEVCRGGGALATGQLKWFSISICCHPRNRVIQVSKFRFVQDGQSDGNNFHFLEKK